MLMKRLGIFAGIIGVLVIIGILAGTYITYNNKYVTLKNLIAAKQTDIENNYDAMWKILSQQAQVSDKYKEGFKEIYIGIMEGRYQDKGEKQGSLMSWIKEANPQFDSSLYSKLMVSIESNRKEFMNKQTQLIDMGREMENLQKLIPSKFFVPSDKVEIKIITSSKAKKSIESGVDDDVDLFND